MARPLLPLNPTLRSRARRDHSAPVKATARQAAGNPRIGKKKAMKPETQNEMKAQANAAQEKPEYNDRDVRMKNNYATEEQIAAIIQANDDGAFLTGGAPIEEIVNEWDGEGLTVEEVEGYIAARVFRGEQAAQLKEAGITPEQAATRTGSDVGIGCYGDTLGHKVANGDLSVEEAKAWLEAGNE